MGIFLMLTSAIALDGKIAKAGDVVEVSEADAKGLLHRGKAVLAEVDHDQLDDAANETDEQRQAREAAEAAAKATAEAEAEAAAKAADEAEAKTKAEAEAEAAAKAKGNKKAK